MKKLFLFMAILACYSGARAQNGFYFSPHAGVGIGRATPTSGLYSVISDQTSQSSIFCYNLDLGISYHHNKWRVETGIQYLTSGYQLNNLPTWDPASYIRYTKYEMGFNHVGIPLQLGYVAFSKKRFSLVPYLGVLATYNIGAKLKSTETSRGTFKATLTEKEFTEAYNRFSVWGTANLNLEYKLSQKVSAFAGPSFKYMINNVAKHNPTMPEAYQRKQRNYVLTLDLGVSFKL